MNTTLPIPPAVPLSSDPSLLGLGAPPPGDPPTDLESILNPASHLASAAPLSQED